MSNIKCVATRKPLLPQVLVVFSVVVQFHGLGCWRDRAGLTGPQKLVAWLGGSRSTRFFNFNVCSLVNAGRLQEIAWTLKPDIAVLTGTRVRLHGTTFGWIHGCALWLGTWLLHKIVQRSLQ